MLYPRKSIVVTFVAILAFAGLALKISPVYADDGTQPPSDTTAAVTVPDSGTTNGDTGSSAPSVNPPADPPAVNPPSTPPDIEAVQIVSPPEKPADANPTEEAKPAENLEKPADANPTEVANPTENVEKTVESPSTTATAVPTEVTVAPSSTPVPAQTENSQVNNNPSDGQDSLQPANLPTSVITTQAATEVPVVELKKDPTTLAQSPIPDALNQISFKDPNTELPTPNIVVVDPSGSALPSGSQAASDALISPDPYFYVGTTKYSFSSADCDPSSVVNACSNPIQAALNYISSLNLSPVGGNIYVEAGTYNEDISIAKSSWANPLLVPASLSLIGAGTTEKSIGSSVDHILNGSISVTGIKSFTLQAFTVTKPVNGNLVWFDSNTGTINISDVTVQNTDSNGWGLVVYSNNGPVNLVSVNASGNGRSGAWINNVSTTAQPVSVINSSFGSNGSTGLVITSKGAVSIKNTVMSDNSGSGLTVTTDGAVTLNGDVANKNVGTNTITSRDVTITQSIFNENSSAGLELEASAAGSGNVIIQYSQFIKNTAFGAVINKHGNVSLTSVRAAQNGMNGFWIDTLSDNIFTGNVTVIGSAFTDNMKVNPGTGGFPYAGLGIQAKGIITITNSASNNNGDSTHISNGAYLSNRSGLYAVNVTNTYIGFNSKDGLLVYSNGVITVKDSNAENNVANGMYLSNQNTGIISGVNILNSAGYVNTASNNGMDGLGVYSNGIVVINAVKAVKNGINGIYVDNSTGTGAVTIDGVSGTVANENSGSGVSVVSKGVITVKNMDAQNNHAYGYLLNNLNGTNTGVNVQVTLPRWYNGLNGNGINGLNILSKGAVVIQKTNTNSNGYYGAYIDNSQGIGTVTISDSQFNDNSQKGDTPAEMEYGLFIQSKGGISLTNVRATDNGNDDNVDDANDIQAGGAWLDNSTSTTAATIIITNGTFDNNFGNGLNVLSKGAITYTTGSANNNYLTAVNLDNHLSTLNQTVIVTSVNMGGNRYGTTGLTVLSKGNIAITKSDINGFNGEAVNLNNHYGTGSISVTGETGWWRYFGNNVGNGLTIFTSGSVTLNYLTINDNGGYGTQINTTGNLATVTLSNMDISNNGLYGLDVDALSTISLDDVRVVDNKSYGINLNNSSGTGTVTVKSLYGQEIRNNSGYGLWVISKGSITITNIDIHNNNGFGTCLDNSMGTTGTVTINNTWNRNWSQNADYGLTIYTSGSVTLNNLTINDNGGYGTQINTTGSLATVTLSNLDISNNTSFGLDVNAVSTISLDNVRVVDNKSYGINLNNSSGTGTVTVKSTNGQEIRNNSGYGLWVTSKGNITLTNIEIHDNGGFGAWLDNSMGTTGTVTINSTMYRNWNRNGDYGLQIDSPGAVIVTWVDAYQSGTYGADINNTYAAGALMPTVTITNSWFNFNHGGYGLNVDSKGSISLTNVDANDNNGYGADLNNLLGTGTVTITGPSVDDRNDFNNNADYGLNVQTRGAVTVNYLGARDNAFYGANIDNSTSTLPQAVSLTSLDLANNSRSINDGYGLTVLSKGAITLFETFAYDNGEWGPITVTGNGMHLDNCLLVGGKCTGSGTVTLTSSNTWGNNGYGMDIQSYGQITLSDVSSGYNALYGGKFNNAFVKANTNPLLADIPSIAGITVSLPLGYSSEWGCFQNNGQYGFSVTSNGAVSVSGVRVFINSSTSDSDNSAVYINNSTSASPMAVTVSNSTFYDNDAISGITVYSKGAITFTKNLVNNNHHGSISGTGAAVLDNHTSTLPQNVTVTGSSFNGNGSASGLMVKTKGNVQLTDTSAIINGEDGINIDSSFGKGTVTILGTNANNSYGWNARNGASITANGKVTISNLEAEFNTSGVGLYVNTLDYGTDGTGTLSVTNASIGHNGGNGIQARTNGTIALTAVISTVNGTVANNDGANLVTNSKDITITNSSFMSNVGRGITSDTGAGKTLKLVNTMYFGNDTNKSGDSNLYNTGLISIA